MKKTLTVAVAMLAVALLSTNAFCAKKVDGKKAYDQKCGGCHPNGGNVMNPQKTLSAKQMAANGVKSEKDIIALMRNPKPGMTKFSTKTVPDAEAKAIAEYVLKTFK